MKPSQSKAAKPKRMTSKAVPAKAREYTPAEVEAARRLLDKRKQHRSGRLKVVESGKLGFDHESQLVGQVHLMEALGVADEDFLEGLLEQLALAGSKGQQLRERETNFMLSVIKGIEPSDQVEVMLGAEMAATHMAAMAFARRLNHVDTIQQQDSAERTLNRLQRTFVSQMEALRKYRNGGEQKVTVQHVHVNEGGQAVVGNVTHGRQAKDEQGGWRI
ncbi:MAG: hypothetical protein R3D34_16890 [Nitratireductor sp.]